MLLISFCIDGSNSAKTPRKLRTSSSGNAISAPTTTLRCHHVPITLAEIDYSDSGSFFKVVLSNDLFRPIKFPLNSFSYSCTQNYQKSIHILAQKWRHSDELLRKFVKNSLNERKRIVHMPFDMINRLYDSSMENSLFAYIWSVAVVERSLS